MAKQEENHHDEEQKEPNAFNPFKKSGGKPTTANNLDDLFAPASSTVQRSSVLSSKQKDLSAGFLNKVNNNTGAANNEDDQKSSARSRVVREAADVTRTGGGRKSSVASNIALF